MTSSVIEQGIIELTALAVNAANGLARVKTELLGVSEKYGPLRDALAAQQTAECTNELVHGQLLRLDAAIADAADLAKCILDEPPTRQE